MTARFLGKFFFSDGDTLERCYKDSLSGFREWYQLEHASAESLNSKMKGFRARLRGVSDLPFFMYRLCQIFG